MVCTLIALRRSPDERGCVVVGLAAEITCPGFPRSLAGLGRPCLRPCWSGGRERSAYRAVDQPPFASTVCRRRLAPTTAAPGRSTAACHTANEAYVRKSVVFWDEFTSTSRGEPELG